MTVADQAVIDRLRTSKEALRKRRFEQGKGLGRIWAEKVAEAAELSRLESHRDERHDWLDAFDPDLAGTSAYSDGEIAFGLIFGVEIDRKAAADFWGQVHPEAFWQASGLDTRGFMADSDIIRGFLAGALELWDEIKDEV